jgi:ATP-dependent Lon protease
MREWPLAGHAHAVELDIPDGQLGSIEVHIHVPAGAVPKDGPSAGITIAAALASALSGRPARSDVAMTGEISLTGRVLQIGGVKEKVLGAHRAGIRRVVLPTLNRDDLPELPEEVRDALLFDFVDDLADVFRIALRPRAAEVVNGERRSHIADREARTAQA